ncbi:hypothetical protein ED733_003647 [Metarhizium rileyi]|uniref:Protein kinase domain-containing protein n=1 Tax=Metarhizium rileyi (strain RCEF 4871) TaxID=1649241 RepID=A0A5C6GBX0_METRR|nr:hypothetical protein ED733_003647 [Metarhizium rileyi]
MYPDWPDSAADLVPLPQCVGPKLKPFDFRGPQKIDFLEFLGEGRHGFVFKVTILGRIYALKLFRFDYVDDWADTDELDDKDINAVTTMYNYVEPFNCECRSFGRLQEAGYAELAIECFGYVLLDDKHERIMMEKFADADIELEFDGNVECPGCWPMRSLWPGKSGRPPPIRGIVKEFGSGIENFKTTHAARYLKDIKQFHQLGIIGLDVAERQLINGKVADFSTAITFPNITTNSELSPHLSGDYEGLFEFQTFLYSINDYWMFDMMVAEWNMEQKEEKTKVSVRAFPSGRGCNIKYDLRNTPSRERVYTYIDPRKYDWKACTASSASDAGAKAEGPMTRQRAKRIPRLAKQPPRWYYSCGKEFAVYLRKQDHFTTYYTWHSKDGLVFPRRRSGPGYGWR